MHTPLARELKIAADLAEPFCALCGRQTREFRLVRRQLMRLMFARGAGQAYALIDGARWPGLPDWLAQRGLDHRPLFALDSDEDLLAMSPRLVRLPDEDAYMAVFQEIWGGSHGLFLCSTAGLETQCSALAALVYAEMPDGEISIFRFWDPRVMDRFVGLMTPAQASALFAGGLTRIFYEGPGGSLRDHAAPQTGMAIEREAV